jgi:glycosyltransferase involved in cell wall biosynthesis
MKLVSVIIPCYKNSETLSRAVKSVIAQSYPSIEIIVVNDCSPESEEIETVLLDYPEVHYLRNIVNVGPAATRNNGLAFAHGEIVAFLDADDEYHPAKIKLQVAALEPNTVVTCGLIYRYPDGHEICSNRSERTIESPDLLLYRNTLNGAGLLAPKDLLIHHCGYESALRSNEDFDLWLRLLSSEVKVKDIGLPLYVYNYNTEGLSKNLFNISKWEMIVVQRHASRMGSGWVQTKRYRSVMSAMLLRHCYRSELSQNVMMRKLTYEHISLLRNFPFAQALFRIILKLRLLIIPVIVVKIKELIKNHIGNP